MREPPPTSPVPTLAIALVSSALAACGPLPATPATSARQTAPVVAVEPVSPTALVVAAPEPPEHAAGSADEGDEASVEDAFLVTPCRDPSAQTAAARGAQELGRKIDALADDGDPKPATAALDALLASPCYELGAGDTLDALAFDSALSLRQWWYEGGATWIASYPTLATSRTVVVPPTPRRSLTLGKATAKTPLAPLLCPAAGKPGCGRATAGWARRADARWKLAAVASYASWAKRSGEECEAEALEEVEANERYSRFRACLEELAPKRTALPVGRFDAPSDGWFVVQRGDPAQGELRAYDLATGAAIVVAGCGPCGTATTKTGRVALAPLREAAWMTLLWRTAERRVRTYAATFEVPKTIAIERPRGGGVFGTTGGCGATSATWRWSWMRHDKAGSLAGQASGILRPTSCLEPEEYAAELLRIADDSFEEGCSPSRNPPPRAWPWSKPGSAIAGGAVATFDAPSDEPFRLALAQAKTKSAGCAKPR